MSTTIIGVGNYLTELLVNKYGYNVIHDTSVYDYVDGKLDRSKAYTYAENGIEKILADNPTIEVVIDLHRDGIDEDRRLVTEINGKDTAQILFYNGLSYTNDQGKVSYLPNPYIQDNLAFFLFSWNIRRRCIILIFTEGFTWRACATIFIYEKEPCFWKPVPRQIRCRK